MKLLFTALLSVSLAAQSFAYDVEPFRVTSGDRYVRVSRDLQKQTVTFEDCIFGEENSSCRGIGSNRKGTYLIKDIKSKRTLEYAQVAFAGVADVAVVFACVAGGTAIAGLSGFSLYGGGSAGIPLWVGVTSGTAAGAAVDYAVAPLNPYEQYKQAETLNDDVLADRTYIAKDIDTFIERLTVVLNKL